MDYYGMDTRYPYADIRTKCGEDLRSITKNMVAEWYRELKLYLLKTRKISVSRNSSSFVEAHHAILTRRDAQGAFWKPLIHSEFNIILLSPAEHRPQPPTKEICWNILCDLYSEDIIQNWYNNIPYKTGRPPRYF